MKIIFAFTIVIALPMLSFGQIWVARYNGPGNDYDKAAGIAIDGSSNIYVTGTSWGAGTYNDYATIKYDSSGDSIWVARYDGPDNMYDEAKAIAIDDTYIYVTGGSMDANLYTDYVTIKYDSSGDSLWVARYNNPAGFDDHAYAIGVDASGNVYVTGYSTSVGWDCTTVKYDSSGVEQWVQTYTTNDQDYAIAIAIDASGNSFVAGSSGDPYFATWDYITIKYDSSGVEQWAERYNGPVDGHDEARAIALDSSGNVIVAGGSAGSGSNSDYTTIKYNPLGDSLWVVRYNGLSNGVDWANAIAVDDMGNIYVTGGSAGSGLDWDYATIKYDSSGVEQWVVRYNGPVDGHDEAKAITLDASGNVYVIGYSDGSGTGPDYATVKYDSSGVEQWVVRYNGPGNNNDYAYAIAVDDAGYFYVTGESEGSGTGCDFATIKYSCLGVEEKCSKIKMQTGKSLRIYPNPFNQSTYISLQVPIDGRVSLRIYDVTGRLVRTLLDEKNVAGDYSISFNARGIRTGIYFAKLVVSPFTGAQVGEYQEIKKLILAR